MLGGFQCSRTSLIVLNIFYIIVGIVLIYLGAHWMTSNRVSSLPIIGGVVFCGVFLLVVSIGGIYATVKQHQVLLFFYMVILFCLFIVQFSVASACLAVSLETQAGIATKGWTSIDFSVKENVQQVYQCCGFRKNRMDLNLTDLSDKMSHPTCKDIKSCWNDKCHGEDCCTNMDSVPDKCSCPDCLSELEYVIGKAFRVTGGVSLFFSFTEFIGIWLTVRYRNTRNPFHEGDPSAFL